MPPAAGHTLALATDAQKRARDAVTYAEWGPPLAPEAFLAREVRLRAHPWCAAGMETWLLQDAGGAVLASCETFHTPSFLDGVAGDSWSVASVYTEAPLRGRGHATELMDRVADALAARPRAQAVALYSDVGERLYARSGYAPAPAFDWHFPPAPGDAAEGVDALVPEAELAAALARVRRPAARFYQWPTAAQVDWHLERERIYAQALGRPRPPACGARVGDSTALWAGVLRSGYLAVLLLDARSPADAARLLTAARRAAAAAGLARVTVWEGGDGGLLSGVPGGARAARDGALPMLRALRPGLPPAAEVPFPRALWV